MWEPYAHSFVPIVATQLVLVYTLNWNAAVERSHSRRPSQSLVPSILLGFKQIAVGGIEQPHGLQFLAAACNSTDRHHEPHARLGGTCHCLDKPSRPRPIAGLGYQTGL
jgi:hypothetical protein